MVTTNKIGYELTRSAASSAAAAKTALPAVAKEWCPEADAAAAASE